MGNNFTCPFLLANDLENAIESIHVNSIGLGDNAKKATRRFIGFDGHNTHSKVSKSSSSGKRNVAVEGSVSFKTRQSDYSVSVDKEEEEEYVPGSCISYESTEMDEEELSLTSAETMCEEDSSQESHVGVNVENPKHEAALKLQKVYKSFRTRRKLADCAIIVENIWWKLLDFAELKHSSISFFDMEHQETAISRWFRAKIRAAKVGKGLSKSVRAQKLALQHWLEAIDPRHRYGHNLHFYYAKWLHSQSREPFFYWLDIGEGKEVNLEKCPRCPLQQQCIKYLCPMGRKAYEVVVENGKLFYLQRRELLHTTSEPDAKWIFVLSTTKNLYVGKKKKGTFQHSSFLAGGATSAAGRLVVDNGILQAVWPHSGHYTPTEENFQDFILFLKENNVDLIDVKMSPVGKDEAPLSKQRSSHRFRTCPFKEDLTQEKDEINNTEEMDVGRTDAVDQEVADVPQHDLLVKMQREKNVPARDFGSSKMEAPSHGGSKIPNEEPTVYDYDDTINSVSDKDKEDREEIIPKESIIHRINSHKKAKSYQLGWQLSCKWTSGAGPRIGCVRDYPSELQAMALEHLCLCPRSSDLSKSLYSSPRYMTTKVSQEASTTDRH